MQCWGYRGKYSNTENRSAAHAIGPTGPYTEIVCIRLQIGAGISTVPTCEASRLAKKIN